MMRLTDRQAELSFGLLLLLSVMLAALAGEGLMRLFALRDTGLRVDWATLRSETIRIEPETGMDRFIPHTQSGRVRINSIGFRGPEPLAPGPDLIRIGMLGDSTLLAAELDEGDAPAALLVDQLRARWPACRFDYILAAGPDYSMADMGLVARDGLAPTAPDIHLLMAGRVPELLAAYEGSRFDALPVLAEIPGTAQRSRLFFAFWRLFHWRREERRSVRIDFDAILPDEEVEALMRTTSWPLRAALKSQSVLAIVDSGLLREDTPAGLASQLTRWERTFTRALAPSDFGRLKRSLSTGLTRAFADEGWTVIDPLEGIDDPVALFLDSHHLNEAGAAHYARSAAAAIEPLVLATGKACLDS